MQDQPKYKPYRASTFFEDGQSSRQLVEGTVARGQLRNDPHLYLGKSGPGTRAASGQTASTANGNAQTSSSNTSTQPANTSGASQTANQPRGVQTGAITYDPSLATTFPFPITEQTLNRGQERYQVFCAMCHGETGQGDGMIVRRGFRKPPAYNSPQLLEAPVGHFFDVITNGWGAMPSYAYMIPVEDRWAIIAYLRALQLSQNAKIDDVPAEERGKLGTGGGQR
jgi:mono/diheme cytochrome c family protein